MEAFTSSTSHLTAKRLERYRHPLLQLMPYGEDAPAHLLALQDAVMGALAEDVSPEERAQCIQDLTLRANHVDYRDDGVSLEIEVLERVTARHPNLIAFELLAVARLHHYGLRLSKWPLFHPAVRSADRADGQLNPGGILLIPSDIKEVWSTAVSHMLSLNDGDINRLSADDALAGIRMLRAHVLYGDTLTTSPTAEQRLIYFRGLAMGLWNALLPRARTAPAFDTKHEEEFGIQGQQIIMRRLEGELATERLNNAVAPTPPQTETSALATPGHVVVIATTIPPSQNADDSTVLARYEILCSPLPIAELPDISRIEAIQDTLETEFPWAHEAINLLMSDLRSRRLFGSIELGTEPTLLVGLPGCGKSRLVRRIAEELAVPFCPLALAAMNDSMPLVGTARGWASAQASPLINTMVTQKTASLLVLLDEIDKVPAGSIQSVPPTTALLNLLERENARRWYDTFIQTPCNLSKLMFWATANSLKAIPKPLLSRFRIMLVPPPRREHLPALAQSAARDICHEWGLPRDIAPDIDFSELEDHSPSARDIRGAVRILLAEWAEKNLGKRRLH